MVVSVRLTVLVGGMTGGEKLEHQIGAPVGDLVKHGGS